MSQQITVTGTDCFKLAADYLGDADEFWRIMQQNDLTDPVISGDPIVITIPEQPSTATGGVPTQ